MLVKNRIIILFVVVMLMAACTASQAKPVGWSFYYWYDYSCPCWVITIDFHWNTGSSLSVKGFQFDIQYDPTKTAYESESLRLLPPFGPNPPPYNPDLGGGLFRVSGAAPDGTLPPPGEVNLATFEFQDVLGTGVLPLFTVSSGPNGYALLSDGTLLGPDDIDPVSSVPEPGSVAAF